MSKRSVGYISESVVSSLNEFSNRNSIINGGFDVWQRGTSFSSPASAAFTSDRWSIVYDGSGATRTISQQTFTPGTGVTTGHEGRFFYRYDQSVAGSGGTYNLFQNRIEDVRTFAGQTVTISFYGKAATNTSLVKLNFEQNFGSGGSPSADVSTDIASTNFGLTTSWQRFTVTTTVPSISGKTIGTTTSGYLGLRFWIPVNSTFTIDIWGVQLEAGAVATPFEFEHIGMTLDKCQRYYFLLVSGATKSFGVGANITASEMQLHAYFPTTMRATPTLVATSGTNYYDFVRNSADDLFNSLTIVQASTTGAGIGNATEISGTAGHAGRLVTNDANASIAFSAEL